MTYPLSQIIAVLILVLLTQCRDSNFSSENIEKHALVLTKTIDMDMIEVFHRWNYGKRGENEIWIKLNEGIAKYSCFYRRYKDTSYLRFYEPYNFIKDFPCRLSFDTSKFTAFNFVMHQGKVFRVIYEDINGNDHAWKTSYTVENLFPNNNPFDTLTSLSKIKDSLKVYGITYRKDLSDLVSFRLYDHTYLTYFPDYFKLGTAIQEQWEANFTSDKVIGKNWKLQEYKH